MKREGLCLDLSLSSTVHAGAIAAAAAALGLVEAAHLFTKAWGLLRVC